MIFFMAKEAPIVAHCLADVRVVAERVHLIANCVCRGRFGEGDERKDADWALFRFGTAKFGLARRAPR